MCKAQTKLQCNALWLITKEILGCLNSHLPGPHNHLYALPLSTPRPFLLGRTCIFGFDQSLFMLRKQWNMTCMLITPSKTILKPFWVSHSLMKVKSCSWKTPDSHKTRNNTQKKILLDQNKNLVQIPYTLGTVHIQMPKVHCMLRYAREEGILKVQPDRCITC